MKFSIERAALLKAVSQAQSVVERRNTIPILANVLIEAEGSDASFRATDLDIEVVDKAPAQVERAGATTVSATGANILRIDMGEKEGQLATVDMEIAVTDRIHLARAIKKLRALRAVSRVIRV